MMQPQGLGHGGSSGAPASTPRLFAAEPHEYTVELVRDVETFAALREPWNALVERAGVAHPFLRHEWVQTWWESFGHGARLNVLVVRRERQIVAIAPLMRDDTPIYGVRVRRLRFLQNDHTPRTDLIVGSDPEGSCRAIWQALHSEHPQWDLLQLNQLERGSATGRILSVLAAASGNRVGVWRSGDSPYLRLVGTWEAYWNGLPAKFRSNLRNRLSRLTRIGEPRLEVLTDGGAIRDACHDAWRLEASGWKSDAGTSIGSDADVQRFYTDLISRGAAAGWMRLLFLNVGGLRIATAYGACFRGRLLLFKTGYDPEYAPCAPFKLLTYFAVRDAYEEGLHEVDFLGDSEPWKLEWTSAVREHEWLFVFGPSVRARLLHSLKFEWGPELKRWRT
jgi:CelD/BcsL family acetyltransferase involved in cellulose biosynthesis